MSIDNPKITKINVPKAAIKKVLFLGYDSKETRIISVLTDKGCEVHHTKSPMLNKKYDEYDLIVSFGYKHILKSDFINKNVPIVNLHISYLPYNRGADPNFWSFYDETPAGVSIHLVDEGIDTGPVLYQKLVKFNEQETTFSSTYVRLIKQIEDLFVTHIDDILYQRWVETPQRHKGTFHKRKDMPADFKGWDSNIREEIKRLKL